MLAIRQFAFSVAVVAFFSLSTGLADDWPQFRGVTGSGVSGEKNLPVRWSADDGVLWTVDLPGRANSSPALTESRIDLTTQQADNSLWILSFDRENGRLLRKVKVGSGVLAAKGSKNLYAHRHNAATPTPAADEETVYAFFGTGLLLAVDVESGRVKWRHDKGPSYVVAFDKRTGEEVWKTDRKLPAADDGPDAYSTPFVFENNGRRELLVSGSDHVTGYDLESGERNWISGGLTITSEFGRVIASVTATDGVVVATSGNPGGGGLGHVIAVRGGGEGDVTATHRLWKHGEATPDSSTPLGLDGRVYMASDSGIASCLNLKTGEVAWRKRLPGGPYHASLVAGDGKVYFLSIDGTCTVIAAGDDGETIATNRLPGTFYATPAISDGVIYLRAYERLYAIGGK